jgi:hypothetical protein
MKRLALLLCATLLGGCIDVFEDLWFNPVALESYEWPHNDIPEEYLEVVELTGTAVGDETEAPTIFGVWAKQCLDNFTDNCADIDHPFFNEANRAFPVLYFHGNGGNLPDYWDRVQILWRMGFTVFAVDYREFGRSTGSVSEAGVYADARTALNHALQRRAEADPSLLDAEGNLPTARRANLWYYGWSLGSTAAIDLSVEHQPRILITEAALASAQAFTDDALGIGISSSVLMDAEFDNVGKVPFILVPKLFTHGLDDDFVKSDFSNLLFDAAPDPKAIYMVPGAVHGSVPCPTRDTSIPSREAPCLATDSWYTRIDEFVEANLR